MLVEVLNASSQREEYESLLSGFELEFIDSLPWGSNSILFLAEDSAYKYLETDDLRGLEPNKAVFVNVNYNCLYPIFQKLSNAGVTVFGYNGWVGMVNRPIIEISVPGDSISPQHQEVLDIFKQKGLKYTLVKDAVGMATPRVLSMIINEAWFMFQEGSGTKEDIDLSMKLGTNYPYGPFEWGSRIGLSKVVKVLDSVWEHTKDERYKVCPALRKAATLGE